MTIQKKVKKEKMLESINVTAKTVDEAIAQGLAQLRLTRDEVDVLIIKAGRRGVFGIGAEKAQIVLTPKPREVPQAPKPKPREVPQAPKPKPPEIVPRVKPEPPKVDYISQSATVEKPPRSELLSPQTKEEASPTKLPPNDMKEQVKAAGIEYLTNLLQLMEVEATVTARLGTDLAEDNEAPPIVLDVTGKDLGILIGRRNATLRALQYIVRLSVNKSTGNRQPILVDVASYRVRRRHSLQQLAIQMAEQAIKSRRRIVLESMSAYERRIIHVTLRDRKSVV